MILCWIREKINKVFFTMKRKTDKVKYLKVFSNGSLYFLINFCPKKKKKREEQESKGCGASKKYWHQPRKVKEELGIANELSFILLLIFSIVFSSAPSFFLTDKYFSFRSFEWNYENKSSVDLPFPFIRLSFV